ncbi:MAG TPA: cytochrome P450 [Acetobacteraceae bacterium]|jgi:unspecific monooxygenase
MNAPVATPLIPPRPPIPPQELGLLPFLRAIRTNALTMWTERAYQDDILVRRFFNRTNVLANTPDAIHRVLVDNHANYRRSPASIRILRPITGENGLLLSEGETWRLQRRTIAPALAPRVMPMLARHIVTTTSDVLPMLAAKASVEPINLLQAMQFLTLEIAGRSMFSLEMQQYCAPLRALLTEYGLRFSQPHLFDMLLPPSVPTFRGLLRWRFQQRWMRLIETIMRDRLHEPEPATPRDLFDLLRAARDPETGAGFSPVQLRDQLATMLLAGHETTAVTLFWALTMLALDPAEHQRVSEEARGVKIEPDTSTDVFPDLVRTRAVVNETLRLYPPAFAIARESIGPDRLGDFDLPPRTVVIIAPWVLHRHRRFWRDPDAFDPDRFMPHAPQPPRFAYLPFGAGPRICVGAQFALTEAVLVLASMLQRFRFELQDEPPLPLAIVTTQPSHQPLFRLHVR